MYDLLSDSKVNEFTGKAMVGALTKDEQFALARHAQAMSFELDRAEDEFPDFLGTEGWRRYLGVSDD